MSDTEPTFHPSDAIGETIKATGIFAGVGLTASAVQNALAKTNVGAMGVFTKTGGTVAIFASVGGLYKFTETVSRNLRQKDDTWNKAVGGFFGGSAMGLRQRSLPMTLGYGAALAIVVSAWGFTGGLSGLPVDGQVDEFARKEFLRKNWRKPAEETIAEVGEGRVIFPEGYEERRRQRLKEKYNLDLEGVPPAH